ncbi:MAG: type VI secretion system tip protein VgrG [Myxococcales bacterium]|nr:type VI secretion system tip protein VgrG [Myxococcales bacterium]
MSVDVFTLHCSAVQSARLVGFRGTEILNRPFELDVFFTVPEGTDMRSAIGAAATLTANRADDTPVLAWHGLFVRLRLVHQTAERALYHGLLVPKLWLLQQHARSHVQTKPGQNVKAFTTVALEAGGLANGSDFRFTTDDGNYPKEEFVCQYRESHIDFVHRWFEREGIYYYFEHAAHTTGEPVMVIMDEKGSYNALRDDGRVRYYPTAAADASHGECLRELHVDLRLLPATVTIADHNYANPSAPLEGERAVAANGRGALHDYGYRVFDAGEARRLAGIKAQSLACRELTLQARGNYLGLRAGYNFEVEEGPAEYPAKYLAIEVRHMGAVTAATPEVARLTGLRTGETYEVDVVAIPQETQFRAPQATAWPRIYGFEHGTVDGPATSTYAQIDDHGRYLVRFHFDTAELADGSTSTYLRMMQPHGGNPEGFHFPLRKNTEVMVGFQGGDPDRPFIAGVVPDATTPSPVTKGNYSQNVLRTGGMNHMIIEDLEGKQFIWLHTPERHTEIYMGHPKTRTLNQPAAAQGPGAPAEVPCTFYLTTDDNAGFHSGKEWWQTVGTNYFLDVGGTARVHYKGIHTINIDADSNEWYNAHRNTHIAAGRTDTVAAGGMVQTIQAGGYTQEITPGGQQTVHGGWKHHVDSLCTDEYGAWLTKATDGWTMQATAKVAWTIGGGGVEINTGKEFKLTAPKIELHGQSYQFHSHEEHFIGNLLEVVGAVEVIGAAIQLHAAPALIHLTGYTVHTGGSSTHTQLHHLENTVTGMKNEATALATRATKLETEVSCIHKFAIAMMG